MGQFHNDFYIFLTPKDDPDGNSLIKIIDPDHEYAGCIFQVEWIKLEKKFLSKAPSLKFHYNVIEPPLSGESTDNKAFVQLVGDIIVDVWGKYYQ